MQRRSTECDANTFMLLRASFLEHRCKLTQLKLLVFEENKAETSAGTSMSSSLLLNLLVPSISCWRTIDKLFERRNEAVL